MASTIPPMPKVSPRRPYDEETFGSGYMESLDDWYENNQEAVEWFLENADIIRSLIDKRSPAAIAP